MTKFAFLTSMPRAGNTLLSSILNQNKNITVTPNSIVPDILFQIEMLKNHISFHNFPYEKGLNNVKKNIMKNYYSSLQSSVVLDRGPWGTPVNLKILKQIIPNPKFIIIYRPVLEVLASFLQKEKPVDKEMRAFFLMNPDTNGAVIQNLISIKNLLNKGEKVLIIHYKDLITNFNDSLNQIYRFLDLKPFKHKVTNFKQFAMDDTKYDDSVLDADIHKIKTDKINYKPINVDKILSSIIINKYRNYDVI